MSLLYPDQDLYHLLKMSRLILRHQFLLAQKSSCMDLPALNVICQYMSRYLYKHQTSAVLEYSITQSLSHLFYFLLCSALCPAFLPAFSLWYISAPVLFFRILFLNVSFIFAVIYLLSAPAFVLRCNFLQLSIISVYGNC